jgi:hypothetical protein
VEVKEERRGYFEVKRFRELTEFNRVAKFVQNTL